MHLMSGKSDGFARANYRPTFHLHSAPQDSHSTLLLKGKPEILKPTFELQSGHPVKYLESSSSFTIQSLVLKIEHFPLNY